MDPDRLHGPRPCFGIYLRPSLTHDRTSEQSEPLADAEYGSFRHCDEGGDAVEFHHLLADEFEQIVW
jgi:hypothetical protein